MKPFQIESLSYDPLHGYIPFVSVRESSEETTERDIIDHPWVQRLRQIHQLQTAWWVYPTAEHTRFQHVLGSMHMGSRACEALYESLKEACPDAPSRGYVESLLRMAALLHDVGHGPFGHFFDEHFLKDFGLTHETLGAKIVVDELGPLLAGVRRNPAGCLEPGETLDPRQIAFLITRPGGASESRQPRWLEMLRCLFCGIYTVDNMDFVLRDAFMSGYSTRSYDVDRLLQYSFFSEKGLTIHRRGIDALLRFMHMRAQLFRAVYFHRTVRAIDLTLADLFADSKALLFPGNPLDHLPEYQLFTEWSLLVDVARWSNSGDVARRRLGQRWQDIRGRRLDWRMACERNLVFTTPGAESTSVFSDASLVERSVRQRLPRTEADEQLRIDLPRHIYRPGGQLLTGNQNYLYQPERDEIRPLVDDQLFRQLPLAHRFCRIYVPRMAPAEIDRKLAAALDGLLGEAGLDDATNM